MNVALALFVMLLWPLDYRLLRVEDARGDAAPLVAALEDEATVLQAIRALGRFERPELARHVLPFLASTDAEVRIEAANAIAQMRAEESVVPALVRERDPRVRAALYEALGRLASGAEELLVAGLAEAEPARRGATKGLEHFYRTRDIDPSAEALEALRRVVLEADDTATLELALLALHRAEDRDEAALVNAARASEPGVRRFAVRALGEWRDDPSPRVRYEALRASGDCARAEALAGDPDGHVALLAIDLLGEGCPTAPLERVLEEKEGWRRQAHALVALAKLAPERARERLGDFVAHPVWQARVYAARAAKALDDGAALARLRADAQPNVVAEALVTPEQALDALGSDHYGLLMAALGILEERPLPDGATPRLLSTLDRLTREGKRTSRDPRRLLLERLRASGEASVAAGLEALLADFDPVIARLAADGIGELTGRVVEPETTRFTPDPLPEESYLRGLAGARARIRMKEAGAFVIELLPEVAPLTVAQFAKLAEAGYYDGLTFHRVVPGFVIQGGSPGANEYVGTAGYLRDEVSTLSHLRGTLGISTRGRDTGDSQIFVNLEDNFRLDHDYTVFARVVEGMENVDGVLEGDVMERVELLRASP